MNTNNDYKLETNRILNTPSESAAEPPKKSENEDTTNSIAQEKLGKIPLKTALKTKINAAYATANDYVKKIGKTLKNAFLDEPATSPAERELSSPDQEIPTAYTSSPSNRTTQEILNSSTERSDCYRGLVDSLSNTLTPEDQRSLYNDLENKFRDIEHADSDAAWVQQADLLDAIDKLVTLSNGVLKPLRATQPPRSQDWKGAAVLLVPFKRMKEAIDKVRKQTAAIPTPADFQKEIGAEIVEIEDTKTAKMVQTITRQKQPGKVWEVIYRTLTRERGVSYYKPLRGNNALAIAHCSRELGIQSHEFLVKKERDSTGKAKKNEQGYARLEQYYRGPKFLFGQTVHDYRTINDWFKRDLTSEARREYLQGVETKEAKLEAAYGSQRPDSPNPISRIAIANSDCRTRQRRLGPGEFGTPQELTGKVLNIESEKQATSSGDDPAYYEEKYKFSTKNLIGREMTDPIGIVDIDENLMQKFEQQIVLKLQGALIKGLEAVESQLSPGDSIQGKVFRAVGRQINKLNSAKTKRMEEARLLAAQHELLGGMWRAFNESGAIQIVQRLAPVDVHNYVAPLNGKPLNHKEACEILRDRLQKRLNALSGTTENAKREEIQKEIDHFKELITIFEQQEKDLERPSQATIDIAGTNASVSTPAIQNRSSILAQNDRKVMMFLHEDGNFSMHVFIGATAVNKVDVDQQTKNKMTRGDRQGDMQFGPDKTATGPNGETISKADLESADKNPKLRLGEWAGGFPINGSTVISFYLPNDFSPLPKVDAYKKNVAFGHGIERGEVELKVNMGDPLLIKTDILFAQVLERWGCIKDGMSLEEVQRSVKRFELPVTENADMSEAQKRYLEQDREILARYKELLTKETPLSFDENELLENINKTIQARLEILKGS